MISPAYKKIDPDPDPFCSGELNYTDSCQCGLMAAQLFTERPDEAEERRVTECVCVFTQATAVPAKENI